jgi:hypothetical protein
VVTEPLRVRQSILYREYKDALEAYLSLSPEEQKDQDKPELKQVLSTDATTEAIKKVLDANPNGIGYMADELASWVRSWGQYKGGRGDDRQSWLAIWSSSQIVRNRAGSEPIVIDDPFVCVTGGLQPSILNDVIDDSREDGLSARILFSYPDPLKPADWKEVPIKGADKYAQVCEALWNLKPSDEPMTFSKTAKEKWVTWVNALRKQEPPVNLKPCWSKAEGHSLRIALILFLSRKVSGETKATEIDVASVEGAVRLTDYFLSHARRVYAAAISKKDDGRIGHALRWISKHLGQGHKITARLAKINGLTKDTEEAKMLFLDLQELGHGDVVEGPQGHVEFRLHTPPITHHPSPSDVPPQT